MKNKEAYKKIRDDLSCDEIKFMFDKFIMMAVVAIEFLENLGLEEEFKQRLKDRIHTNNIKDLMVRE